MRAERLDRTCGKILPFALLGCLLASSPLCAEDWRQFRGPNASGVAGGSYPVPTEFSQTEKVKWSARLGDSVASPIVVGGLVFATGMVDEKFCVFCFEAATGKPVWKREFDTGKLPRITPPNSHASSTPATDGNRVYVYFSTLGLMALDVSDGKTVWDSPIPLPAYLMDWGAASSPIVYRDLVIFCQDDDLSPMLYAFD